MRKSGRLYTHHVGLCFKFFKTLMKHNDSNMKIFIFSTKFSHKLIDVTVSKGWKDDMLYILTWRVRFPAAPPAEAQRSAPGRGCSSAPASARKALAHPATWIDKGHCCQLLERDFPAKN